MPYDTASQPERTLEGLLQEQPCSSKNSSHVSDLRKIPVRPKRGKEEHLHFPTRKLQRKGEVAGLWFCGQ